MQNTYLSFEPSHGQNGHYCHSITSFICTVFIGVYLFCFLHKETYGKAHNTHWHSHRTYVINGWTFNFSSLSCCGFPQENVEEFPGMSAVQNRKREIYHNNQMHFQNGYLSITLKIMHWSVSMVDLYTFLFHIRYSWIK